MQSLKVKLTTTVTMFIFALSMLIIGVWAVVGETQHINLSGSVNFTISDNTLYIKDVRVRETGDSTGQGTTIDNFLPGFVNGDININLGTLSADTSFSLLFDVINTTETTYQASTTSVIPNASLSVSGIINGDGIEPSAISSDTEPSGTIVLTVIVSSAGLVSLDGVVINIEEYVEPALQVTNVQINDSTPDTTTEFNGVKGFTSTIDLSNITFETGQTDIIISMTSLNANYIKNIVSYNSGVVDYNTTGTSGTLFVHSTSLYLPQNTSGQLTSGENKDLKIYVNNNTGAPTTIPGLKVTFEEKTSLLQNDTANQYYYVEMGTIMGTTQSEYIKWRYISADGENKYTYNPSTAPSGTGYFILETDTLSAVGLDGTDNMMEMPFNADYIKDGGAAYHRKNGWENIAANDYSTSNVRQYINGNNAYDNYTGTTLTGFAPSGRESNMYTDYNIDTENDLVYKNIIERSLGDLYTGMGWNEDLSSPIYLDTTFPTFNEGATIKYTKSDVDKFWLLSAQEVISLCLHYDSEEWVADFWIRSPLSSRLACILLVPTSGALGSYAVTYYIYAVRPAFKFSI